MEAFFNSVLLLFSFLYQSGKRSYVVMCMKSPRIWGFFTLSLLFLKISIYLIYWI